MSDVSFPNPVVDCFICCAVVVEVSKVDGPGLWPHLCPWHFGFPATSHVWLCPAFFFCCTAHFDFLLVGFLFFPCPSFYISTPSHKPGPGKLDYHSNSIFQILCSFGRLGAEQRRYYLESTGSLITGLSRYAGPTCFALRMAGLFWLRHRISLALSRL